MLDSHPSYGQEQSHFTPAARVGAVRRPNLHLLAFLLFPTVLILAAMVQPWWPYSFLFEDAAYTAQIHPMTGAISNIGAFLWCAAVTVCWFTLMLTSRRQPALERAFLFWSGAFSLVLLIDDFFMVHDFFLPSVTPMGERYAKIGLLVMALLYALAFRRILLRQSRGLLAAAVACLFGSLFFDNPKVAATLGYEGNELFTQVAEDGLKLYGITLWCAFLMTRAAAIAGLERRLR